MTKLTTYFPEMLQKVCQKQLIPAALFFSASPRIGLSPNTPPPSLFSQGNYLVEIELKDSSLPSMTTSFPCFETNATPLQYGTALITIPEPLIMLMPNRIQNPNPPWFFLKPPWPPP